MDASPPPALSQPPPLPGSAGNSDKRILIAVALAGTIGFLGLHRFYAGRYFTGAVQLVLFAIGAKLLGHDLVGITSLHTLDDVLDWAARNPVKPGPWLLVGLPATWAVIDCLALLARRFKDGAGKRMTRWI